MDVVRQTIRQAGLDVAGTLAQALASGESAARTVADGLGNGTRSEDVQEMLADAVKIAAADAAKLLEFQGYVPEGDGAIVMNWAMNETSPKVGKHLLHGVLLGDRRVYEEIVERFDGIILD